MRGERELMFGELTLLKHSPEYFQAVAAHTDDYFARFTNDPEFRKFLSGHI
jgi:hypothetical protein